jgi:hypothetical protein
MVNALRTWENRYLIRSRNAGIVLLGKAWGIDKIVNEGDTVCSVMTEHTGHLVGHVRLSQEQVAEVSVGDQVNIELNKYPVYAYGYLIGEILSVTYIPSAKDYVADIDFPNGMFTTNKNEVTYQVGLTGRAKIVTSARSVMSRMFTPIMDLFANK